jgi:hypothetical protein
MTELFPTEQKPPRVIKVADCYFFQSFVIELVDELKRKAFLVKTGLDTVSKSDQFTYCVLERLGYFEIENLDPYSQTAELEGANAGGTSQ